MIDKRTVSINLLERDRQKEKRLELTVLACLIGILFFGSMTGLYLYKVEEQNQQIVYSNLLLARIQENSSSGSFESSQEVLPEQLQRKAERVRQIEAQNASYVGIIGEVEKCIPEGMELSKISVEPGQLTAKLTAQNYGEVIKMTAALRESPSIKDVCLALTNLNQNSSELEFQFSAEWSATGK